MQQRQQVFFIYRFISRWPNDVRLPHPNAFKASEGADVEITEYSLILIHFCNILLIYISRVVKGKYCHGWYQRQVDF